MVLEDGRYDAIVVDAATTAEGSLSLELAIAAGAHRGEVVTVATAATDGTDPLELLAVPATLTVVEGRPSVELEP